MFPYIHPLILPLGFFFCTNSFVGVIGNAIMLMCYFKNKRLRSPCHILITLSCLSDLMHLTAQFIWGYYLFSDKTNTVAQCFYRMAIPLIGVTAAGPLILAMGIDRLIAVKFPTKYRLYTQEPRSYVMCHLIFPAVYIAMCLAYGYQTKLDKVQITCAVPLGLWGAAFQFFTYTSALIYALVVIVYLTVYILLKSSSASARFKSVFKSISVTVGLVVFGWVTTTVANTLSYEVTSDEFIAIVIQMYAGITVNLAAASNIFVFYSINSEYREVIKSLLGLKNKTKTANFEASSANTVSVMRVHPNRRTTV
ncbi:unnamed protein product [Caenorhabditis angaria]|uniref:G-protein coupled receptors family 1 profile domain-containing protein n=1 Tax=Caenorhabditis angaria TaxID=860376 RepID=A0A9P1N6Y6_9PELO|nr:unnamed protein product [Caenorhabditis angaria]